MTQFPTSQILPDPYVPIDRYLQGRSFGTLTLGNNQLITSANDAVFTPVVFPCDALVYSCSFVAGNGTGNYDLGFYGPDRNLLASTGSTAMSALGLKTLSFGRDIRVYGGILYWVAIALSNTAGQIFRFTGVGGNWDALGHGMVASAIPLPSTATIVNTRRYALPLVSFGVR